MNLPKGKLLALVALVLAASMVMATGAFSSVTAQRSMNVQVVGDENAYLGLQPSPDSDNNAYAKMDGGQLQLNLDENAKVKGGTGVNPDAVSSFDNVFTVTNQGTQEVKVWFEDNNEKVIFYTGTKKKTKLNSEGSAVSIPAGQSKQIGITVNAEGVKKNTQIMGGDDNLVIHAVAPDSEEPSQGQGMSGGSGGDN